MTKIDIEMLNALAVYAGPMTRCRTGKARAGDMRKKKDRAMRWLSAHRNDLPLQD
jgi:hypothetical protein